MTQQAKKLLWVVCLAAMTSSPAMAEWTGAGKADKDYASFNVKKIALVVQGKWKGSEAKVDPKAVATRIKAKLRDKGYDVVDVWNKKQLKAQQEIADAILTIKYTAMVGRKYDVEIIGTNRTETWIDRYIAGTAEMVTPKRKGVKKKTLFKAKGTTQSQTKPIESGSTLVHQTDPIAEFSKIVSDLPPVPGAEEKEEK